MSTDSGPLGFSKVSVSGPFYKAMHAVPNIGALIIRIGFGVHSTIVIIRNPPKTLF